jgi:hypothetical protein
VEIKKEILPTCFSGVKAIVFGGSRGMGESVAKTLACGGADVAITYCNGKDDAEKVADEINKTGGKAECCKYKTGEEENLKPFIRKFSPTHIYYFATPRIKPTGNRFSPQLLNSYTFFYVTSFYNLAEEIINNTDSLEGIFYPSTIFIDELSEKFAEYAIAKSAGEETGRFIAKKNNIEVYAPRLEKVRTDQTGGLFKQNIPDAFDVIKKHLYKFHSIKM